MKILYIIHNFSIGGAEKLVVDYILELAKRNINVVVIEIRHVDSFLYEKIKDNDIPCYTLFTNRRILGRILDWLFLFNRKQISRKINTYIDVIQPDIIHYHTLFRNIDKVKFPSNKSVFTFHSRVKRLFDLYPYAETQIGDMSKNGLNFVAISQSLSDDIRGIFPKAHVWDIPNGIDLDTVRQKKTEKNILCEELSIPQNSFIIGQVGRFHPVKNHIFTIHIFRNILKVNENAHLVFVGTGSEKELKDIHDEITKTKLKEKIHLLGLRDDASSLMSCFDVLLLPSLSESFSLVLLEAQANNIRCVTSDAVPSDVICNANCFSLSLEAPKQEWVDTILRDNVRDTSTSIDKFKIGNVIEQHINMYKRILNGE